MPTDKNLGIAAQCWCDEETSGKEMDAALVTAFAKRLDKKDEQIEILWSLLDDISTAGDMFKPEITPYFRYVSKRCEERVFVANSKDGQTLTIEDT